MSKTVLNKKTFILPAGIRISLTIIIFVGQFYIYKYFYGINSNLLMSIFKPFLQFPIFNVSTLNLPINQLDNIALLIYIVLNSLMLMLLIKLIYLHSRHIKVAMYFMLIGTIMYILTNLLCKATGIFEIGVLSVNILNFVASPLPTVFLIPALNLNT